MSIVVIETSLRESLSAFDELGKLVKFDCGEDGVIVIDARNPPAMMSRDDVEETDCTLEMALDVLRQILDRELDPTSAFMSGRLRVRGDMMVAMELSAVLG
ncbi:MAG TPA: SCP2 sterol-binding domain-containing protein [Acidisphaera sp.]|nr:SCP2 sterol-binding domain-containing protein [Acidisphaera sp.]